MRIEKHKLQQLCSRLRECGYQADIDEDIGLVIRHPIGNQFVYIKIRYYRENPHLMIRVESIETDDSSILERYLEDLKTTIAKFNYILQAE